MTLDPHILRQLIETFQSELDEQIQVMTDGLLLLEKGCSDDAEQDKVIAEIFRAAHNIKGAARSLSINDIGEIAHHMESFFSAIQKKSLTISANLITLCFEALDKMRLAMNAYINNTALSFDLSDLLKRLANGLSGNASEKVVKAEKFDEASSSKVERIPEIATSDDMTIHETVRVSVNSIDHISALMEEIQVNKIAIDDHYNELTKLTAKTKQLSFQWKKWDGLIKNNTENELTENCQKVYQNSYEFLGEISSSTEAMHKNMRSRINELSILSNSLQEEIRKLRLIPATTLLHTFPRYIRDLAHELGKKIELKIIGDDVKIDKMVLEALKDPLIHILRNAVDHGIETPEIRKQNEKNETGHITIQLSDEGHLIHIRIADDGAGINIKNIAAKAENKGILTNAELSTMTDHDILQLIFKPGFSTKEVVTDVSGRGIGLDVVNANLSNLKGFVNVTTDVGKGTVFNLRVPLTLSSERGLMINSNGQTFVIPTSSVERVLILNSNDIVEVEGSQAIIVNKHPIPFRNLSSILGFQNKSSIAHEKLPVVIVKRGWYTVALLVEEIIGEREIVVKPLQSPLNNISYFSGGTLSGNNQVVLVLNSEDIVNMALHIAGSDRLTFQDEAVKEKDRPRVLVVDDSITTRTLEKNILESRSYNVTVAVNGKEAWDLLQKQTFSLLITDVSMPIMDGFTLTEHVKKNEKLREMPVIIVTSLGSDAEKKRGIEVGADAYLIKSEFESGVLLDIVAQLV